jgi:predicted nucleic acid-binding protein
MILLDTNVVSELMKPRPEARVETWLAAQKIDECFLSAITEAELRYGIAILPPGQRRQQLQAAFEGMLEQDFAGRILAFDRAASLAYAAIAADRRHSGQPISQFATRRSRQSLARSVRYSRHGTSPIFWIAVFRSLIRGARDSRRLFPFLGLHRLTTALQW